MFKKLFAWKLYVVKRNNAIKVNSIKAVFSSFILVIKLLSANYNIKYGLQFTKRVNLITIAWSIYRQLVLWDFGEMNSMITKRQKRRDSAINEPSRNFMIREKKHFPPRTLLRHVSGSLSLHTSTEYLQNRYTGVSHTDAPTYSTRFIQPTSQDAVGEIPLPQGSNSYGWSVCTGRLYTGVVPLLMAPLTRSKIY